MEKELYPEEKAAGHKPEYLDVSDTQVVSELIASFLETHVSPISSHPFSFEDAVKAMRNYPQLSRIDEDAIGEGLIKMCKEGRLLYMPESKLFQLQTPRTSA